MAIQNKPIFKRKGNSWKKKGKAKDKIPMPNQVLGNSGKPVTLGTLSLTKFSKHVFQGQGIHDFRKPGTCEASNSRMCEIQES
jgi:hypothetical protein